MRYLNTTTVLQNVKLTVLLVVLVQSLLGQGVQPKVSTLNLPEIWWGIRHPLKVRQAKINVVQTRSAATKAQLEYWPDALGVGDSLDAFRHIYWMTINEKTLGSRAALRLGIAHELSNWIEMEKGGREDGASIDTALIAMDVLNNSVAVCCNNAVGIEDAFVKTIIGMRRGYDWFLPGEANSTLALNSRRHLRKCRKRMPSQTND